MEHRIFSTPHFFKEEAKLINQLFQHGLPCLHLRKPQASLEACQALLADIDAAFHSQIIIHQHTTLLELFELMGYHFRESERLSLTEEHLKTTIADYKSKGYVVGTAVHALETFEHLLAVFDYMTLSPIFPSISKKDYFPTTNWDVHGLPLQHKLVALGGIDAHSLLQTMSKGFRQVAFLGAIWDKPSRVLQNYELICKKLTLMARMYSV